MFPVKHLAKSLLVFTLIINSFFLLSSSGFAGFSRKSGRIKMSKVVPLAPSQESVQASSQETSGNKKAKKPKKDEKTLEGWMSIVVKHNMHLDGGFGVI